jgi:hypothetical protein
VVANDESVLAFRSNVVNQSTWATSWKTFDAWLGTNSWNIGTGGKFVFSGASVTQTQEFTHPGLLLTGGFYGSPTPSSNGVQDVTSFDAVMGYSNNFAVGQLWLTNTTVSLMPTVPLGPVGALFVQDLYLFGGARLVLNDNVRLYFINSNSWNMANITLLGSAEIHQLNSLGEIPVTLAVPEPNVLVLWLSGVLTFVAARRRRRQRAS